MPTTEIDLDVDSLSRELFLKVEGGLQNLE